MGNQLQVNSERFYEWDVADQLKYFKLQAGAAPTTEAKYLYSGGTRLKKHVTDQQGNLEVTVYIDGVYEHRYKKNSAGVLQASQNIIHIMDGRSRIATKRIGDDFGDSTASVKYNLENHLGTSTTRLDDTGNLIDREEFYPFGDSSLRTFEKKRYRYVGKEKDSESGLYYYGARYYSAWTCRFISVDPLAHDYAQLNPYNYAGNRPIGDIDGFQSSGDSTGPPTNQPPIQESSVLIIPAHMPEPKMQGVERRHPQLYSHGGSSLKINRYFLATEEQRKAGTFKSGELSKEAYLQRIFDIGEATGGTFERSNITSSRGFPLGENGEYTQDQYEFFADRMFEDIAQLDETLFSELVHVYAAGYDAGEQAKNYQASGHIQTTTLEFDLLSLGSSIGLRSLAKAAWKKAVLKKSAVSLSDEMAAKVTLSIADDSAKGVTVLGKYPDYINLANELNARRFNIPTDIWKKMTEKEQWAANVKFLDRTIARGDVIKLSNPVLDISKVEGYFRAELDYLIGKGYSLNASGNQLIR